MSEFHVREIVACALNQHTLSLRFSLFLCLVIFSIFRRPKGDLYEHFF